MEVITLRKARWTGASISRMTNRAASNWRKTADDETDARFQLLDYLLTVVLVKYSGWVGF